MGASCRSIRAIVCLSVAVGCSPARDARYGLVRDGQRPSGPTRSLLSWDAAEARRLREWKASDGLGRAATRRDVELYLALRERLPPSGSAARFARRLVEAGFEPASRRAPGRRLGFGLVVTRHRRHGGSSSCVVVAASLEARLVRVRAECSGGSATAGVRLRRRALGPAFADDGTGRFSARFAWPKAGAVLRRRLDARLGAERPVAVPASLRAAYARLRSPMVEKVYGRACGFGGGAPPGRRALEALVEARAEDLLRNVLRGPSPAGRLYAAEGLARLGASSARDERALRAAGETEVATCSGCRFSWRPLGEARVLARSPIGALLPDERLREAVGEVEARLRPRARPARARAPPARAPSARSAHRSSPPSPAAR